MRREFLGSLPLMALSSSPKPIERHIFDWSVKPGITTDIEFMPLGYREKCPLVFLDGNELDDYGGLQVAVTGENGLLIFLTRDSGGKFYVDPKTSEVARTVVRGNVEVRKR